MDDLEQCQTHARIAARQAVMKGLDRDLLAHAFMAEAVKMAFGASDQDAERLARRLKEQALRLLDADYIGHGAGGEPHPVRLLRSESRQHLLANTALKTTTG